MKTSLPRLTFTLIFITTIISLTCMEAKAQSNLFRTLFHGGTYENESQRQALYTNNAKRPLGGLFAPGFTRTLTVLGGANAPSENLEDSIDQDFPNVFPTTGTLFQPPRELDDSGYAVSFAFGRRHSRSLRSEIEVAFRNNDIITQGISPLLTSGSTPVAASGETDGSVNATSIMKNFILEYENNSLFTPYGGIGIGLSYIDVEFGESTEATFQDSQTAFTYQAIAGVSTKLNSFSDFIVEYRFLQTSQVEFDSLNDTFGYDANTLFLGAKFEY